MKFNNFFCKSKYYVGIELKKQASCFPFSVFHIILFHMFSHLQKYIHRIQNVFSDLQKCIKGSIYSLIMTNSRKKKYIYIFIIQIILLLITYFLQIN